MMNGMTTADILHFLQSGTFKVEGLLPWSSNYTFLVQICGEGVAGQATELEAVYKPRRGERPLWDFTQGTLCLREKAAFFISEALSWQLVPPTVLREGPHGLGSVQLFITHDPERHYLTFEGDTTYRPQLQKIALFDILINNADRKSGHVLLQEQPSDAGPARLWTIDHGVCFHTDPKLRTVIWEFAGQPIPENLQQDLASFQDELSNKQSALRLQIAELLTQREILALQKRTQYLLSQGIFSPPGPGRHYPWPPI
jgi:uncharacterized repeat protein (TIGR03843 family)